MKKVIACCDGTWNKPGETDHGIVSDTNVYKISQMIIKSEEQNVFYHPGVGTGDLLDKINGGLTGAGIDHNIKDVYTFLVQNYDDGDEIYLFGFSRGAYTARSVAGMIRNCGILKRADFDQHELTVRVDAAFELYRDRSDDSKPDAPASKAFKSQHSYVPRIKFIGVWDTVGSLGIPLGLLSGFNADRYKFHDTTLSSWVDNAYHALAIDERRYLFEPTLWDRSTDADNPGCIQIMEQRWFTGVHSNIGGGYDDCGLSDLTLRWMIDKARGTDLVFEDQYQNINGNYAGVLNDSFTAGYHLWRKVWRTITPGDSQNQTINDTAWLRYDNVAQNYSPQNLGTIHRNLPA